MDHSQSLDVDAVTALGGTVVIQSNGTLLYTPPVEAFGVDQFDYVVQDSGLSFGTNGRQIASSELTATGTVMVVLSPENDSPVASAQTLTAVEDSGPVTFTKADLLVNAVATDADPLTSNALFDEDVQTATLRVVSFEVGGQTVDADNPGPVAGPHGSTLSFTFDAATREFLSGEFAPTKDYNDNFPADPTLSFGAGPLRFTYTIEDDGVTPGFPTQPAERSVPATVTINVTPENDAPTFTHEPNVFVLEANDSNLNRPILVADLATNILAGDPDPADSSVTTALDERLTTLQFEIVSNTNGSLFQESVTDFLAVDSDGVLSVLLADDAVGTSIIEIRAFDIENVGGADQVATSSTVQVTLNVGPVNDAPVAASETSYTLLEDNGAIDGPATSPFLIPFSSVAGDGLLDVFSAGPQNEIDAGAGGGQTLRVTAFALDDPDQGTLVEVADGLEFTPTIEDFNGTISFTYDVTDSNGGVESNSLTGGNFSPSVSIEDELTTTNRGELILTPVNDRPFFEVVSTPIFVNENGVFNPLTNFAFNIAGGKPTATDEAGQGVEFRVSPVTAADAAGFTTPPELSQSGTLTFEPAPFAFGEFNFEVVLVETTDGTLESLPFTLTIDVRPTNDPPILDPNGSGPVTAQILEDAEHVFSVDGANGLRSSFLPGPGGEEAAIDPGGNQTMTIASIPQFTSSGGTLVPVPDTNPTEYRYTPVTDFVGQDSFVYTLLDNGQSVDAAGVAFDDPQSLDVTVIINVAPVNDIPVFQGGPDINVLEDEDVQPIPNWITDVAPGRSTASDELSGATRQAVSLQSSTPTLVGGDDSIFATGPTVQLNGTDVSIEFTLVPDANGSVEYSVTLLDDGPSDAAIGDVSSVTHTFTISVGDVNDPPSFTPGPDVTVAEKSGAYSEPWATDLSVGPADEAATQTLEPFEVVLPPESAGLFAVAPAIAADGTLSFTTADFASGTVTVGVIAVDSEGGRSDTENPVPLTITITPVDDSPVANDDSFTADEDGVLVIPASDLLVNDTDPDLAFDPTEQLSVSFVSTSTEGATVSLRTVNGVVEVVYDPTNSASLQGLSPGQSLTDTFTYGVVDRDGEDPVPTAVVSITIAGVNDEPFVVDDNVTVKPNETVVINVLDNDGDVDDDGFLNPNELRVTVQPENGGLEFNGDGTLTYVPLPDFFGIDTFQYTVADNLNQQSLEGLVTITVNDPVVTSNDVAGGVGGDALVIDVLSNDAGTPVASTVRIEAGPTNGQAVAQADGTIIYTANPGYIGPDSFTYSVEDVLGIRGPVGTVTLNVVASGLQNPNEFFDVDANGEIEPIDALLIINQLSRSGITSVSASDRGPNFMDVDGNQVIEPLDVLLVINTLSRVSAGGSTPSGEQVLSDTIQVGTDLDLNGSTFEPVSTIEDNTDRVVAASNLEVSVDPTVIELIADNDGEEDEAKVDALDAVLNELF